MRFRLVVAVAINLAINLQGPTAQATESDRWLIGARVGLSAALANGFGYVYKFGQYDLGFDGALGVNVAYRLARRSRWSVEPMLFLARMYVHGHLRDTRTLLTLRTPYLELPVTLRADFGAFHASAGPWVGWPLPPRSAPYYPGEYLSPILFAALTEVGVGFPLWGHTGTLNLTLQPIFQSFADNDGPTWMEAAILFLGYEW